MSREFRWIERCYMHEALVVAAEGDRGRHGVSQALQDIYRALAPVEYGAASFEACDGGFEDAAMALINGGEAIEAAFKQLTDLRHKYAAIAQAALSEPKMSPLPQ